MNILKYIGIIISQIIVSILTVLLIYFVINNYITINSTKEIDPISVANTFMVFVTFIVVVATVIITIAGIIYTNWFAKQKETILKENLNDIIESLLSNVKLKEDILDKILKEQKVSRLIKEYFEKQTKIQKKDFEQDVKNLNSKIDLEINNLENKLKTFIFSQINENKDKKEIQDILKKIENDNN